MTTWQRIPTTGALTTTPQAWTTIAKRAGLWDGQPDTRVQAKRAVERALSGSDLVRMTTTKYGQTVTLYACPDAS
jgi:hypothetical protein